MSVPARNLTLRAHLGDDAHADALATLYVALFAGDPAGAGVEPDGTGGYARVAKTNDATLWGTISGSATQASNSGASGAITFPTLTAIWSQTVLTHWGILDNATGGTLWYSGLLTAPLTVTGAGEVPRIPAGSLTIQAP